MTETPIYSTWRSMLQRCCNPHLPEYKNYGGRGITVCAQWMTFEGFFSDMGARPSGLTLDRIDNNKNYEKTNCRWATRSEQLRNTRRTHYITFQDETHCLTEWAILLGIKPHTLAARIDHHWPLVRALSEPVRPGVALRNRKA